MALPAFKSVGALGTAVGSPTVLWPTHAPGDLGLLCIETCGGEAVPSTPVGWTPLPNSPQATGAGATGTRLTVFYKFAAKSNEFGENPADSGDHNSAVIVVFSGVSTVGVPWDVIAGDVKGTASTSVSLPSVTTTVVDTLIVHIATHDIDIGTAQFSGHTNAALANLTERCDLSSTQGNGGGIAVWTGEKTTAGAIGTTTATVASSVNAMLTIALRPPVPTAGGLPTTSLTAHFDASTTADLFKTFVSGGPHTGVPVDGDSVVVWDHAERSNRIFKQYLQPVPVWRATTPLMALPCLDFSAQALTLRDNADNVLTLNHLITPSTYTLLIAFYAETITSSPGATIRNGHPLIGDHFQEFGAFLHLSGGVSKVSAYNWPSTSHYVTLDCTVGAAHVLMVRHQGGFLYASLDGGAESSIASGNTPDIANSYTWLGGQTGTGASLNGRIGELAIYYNALAGAELAAAITYFTDKWLVVGGAQGIEGATIATNALLYPPHGPGEFIPAPVVESVQIGKTGANTTTHVLSLPSGTTAGDLLLAWLILDSQQTLSYITNPNLTWPDGWNFSSQNYGSSAPAADYPKHAAYWKIAEAGEPSITVTSDEAQKSAYVVVRVSGYRQGSCPVLAASDSGGWSFDPVTGAIENFLILAFTGWRNGSLTADVAVPFGDLGQINDGDAAQGVGVAVASHTFYGTRPVSNADWSYSTEGLDGDGKPLPYTQGWVIAILPPTVDDPVPLYVTPVYTQNWPVLKSRTGAFTELYYERPPMGTGSDVPPVPDPDYPEIVSNESSQVALDSMGRHVLTGDWPPSRPNDWSTTGPAIFEIGPEGVVPGNPNASVGDTPVGGWFNTKECRWTFDQQLVTGLWDDSGWANHYMLTAFYGWTIEMDWYVDPSVRPGDYGLPHSAQLSLYYSVHDPQVGNPGNITYMSVDGFPMPRDQWENKRVRITIEWRCGTITYDPPSATYVDADDIGSIASDGFIRLSLTDLDTNVTTVAFNIQRIPLFIDGWQDSGEPDINYSCGIALGYASQMGPCERTVVEAFGEYVQPPEAYFDPDEAPIGLTWIEFTDASGGFHVWSNIALPDPPSYYGGYKAHRIIEFGPIRRGLSNIDGQYKGIVWFWTMNG